MLAADTQHSWRLVTHMVSVYDADGWLGLQGDSDGTEGGGLSSGADATPQIPGGGAPLYEMISPAGVWARPLDPTVDANGNPDAANSALAIQLFEGGRGYSIPLTDPRVVVNLPPVGKGDGWFYAPGNGVSGLMVRGAGIYKGNTALMTTTDGTPAGQTVMTTNDPSGHKRIGPWGAETFDANGWHIHAHDRTWALDFGAVGGLPGPASEFGGYGRITAPGLFLNASTVVLGVPGVTGSYPVVVMNPQTQALFTAIVSALQALQAEIASLTSSTGPVTSPAAAAAVAAIATLAGIQPALVAVSSTAVA